MRVVALGWRFFGDNRKKEIKNKKGVTLILMLFTGFSGIFGQTESEEKSVWEKFIERRDPRKPINYGYTGKLRKV